MDVVFLLIRLIFGGYFAWHGTRHLDTYSRGARIAEARRRNVPLPLFAVPAYGLMLTVGGVSVATGVFPAPGIAVLVTALILSAFLSHAWWRHRPRHGRAEVRRRFWHNVTLAVLALAFLAIPQPWPLTIVR